MGSNAVPVNKDGVDLFTFIKDKFADISSRVADVSNELKSISKRQEEQSLRLNEIEKNLLECKEKSSKHEDNMNQVQGEIVDIKSSHLALKEQTDRLTKSSNLIVFGVPETDDATSILKELLEIILPDNKLHIKDNRIGEPSEKVRPIRIHLNSRNEVNAALSFCHKLKGNHKFKGISVTRDKTKLQQQQHKEAMKKSPVNTRARKRSIDELNQDAPTTSQRIQPKRRKNISTQEIKK